MDGRLIPIEEIPDPAFSDKTLGEGFAIDLSDGIVVAPFDGEVDMVSDTFHAMGLTSDGGLNVLIHIGIDTVKLKGEGFQCLVKAGDKVKTGQKLMQINLENVKKKVPSMISPVIFPKAEQPITIVKKTVKRGGVIQF